MFLSLFINLFVFDDHEDEDDTAIKMSLGYIQFAGSIKEKLI